MLLLLGDNTIWGYVKVSIAHASSSVASLAYFRLDLSLIINALSMGWNSQKLRQPSH